MPRPSELLETPDGAITCEYCGGLGQEKQVDSHYNIAGWEECTGCGGWGYVWPDEPPFHALSGDEAIERFERDFGEDPDANNIFEDMFPGPQEPIGSEY